MALASGAAIFDIMARMKLIVIFPDGSICNAILADMTPADRHAIMRAVQKGWTRGLLPYVQMDGDAVAVGFCRLVHQASDETFSGEFITVSSYGPTTD